MPLVQVAYSLLSMTGLGKAEDPQGRQRLPLCGQAPE